MSFLIVAGTIACRKCGAKERKWSDLQARNWTRSHQALCDVRAKAEGRMP